MQETCNSTLTNQKVELRVEEEEELKLSNLSEKTTPQLLGKRKQQDETIHTNSSLASESQDLEFDNIGFTTCSSIEEELKLENAQLKQSLLLLVLGADQKEEWPDRWQELVFKVVQQNILNGISNSDDQVFSVGFVRELESYFKSLNTSNIKEWITNRLKPSVAFNSILEPISKKIKMTTNENSTTIVDLMSNDEENIEEASPIF